ncbi:hypothetical protein PV325_001088 [Microctonus aethiopoides]|nr:hypothetical protein PV325_001088 [Microctonus aethiopoides]KAK0090026.1 hypothetical protein PV326_004254 [Microctonus aethiopoides]
MTNNLTWRLINNIFQKNILLRRHIQLLGNNHFKHTNEGYVNLPTQNLHNIDYQEVKSYKQFLNESKTGPETAVSALMKTLDVTNENAMKIVKQWAIFSLLSSTAIIHNDDLLREAGANKSTLRQNMFALGETTSNLRKKIEAIQSIDIDINSAIPLFQLTTDELKKFAFITECDRKELTQHKNRISYLSHRFNYDIYQLCEIFYRHKFMLNIPIVKLIKVTEFLTGEGGLLSKHIVNDLFIYRYSVSRIEERIKHAQKVGISTIKPWIVRCSLEDIDKVGAQISIRNKILGPEKTLVEFISEQLNCSTESVDALIKLDPSIESINIETLLKLLQFYRICGYTIEDIYRSPRALHCDPESVKTKYDMFMQHTSEKPMLFLLVSSNKIFYSKLEAWKKKNNKK